MTESKVPAGRMLVMGRIDGAYGVQGWVKVRPYTEAADGLTAFPRWWIGAEGATEARGATEANRLRETEVIEARVHGGGLVAHLAGVADRDQAERLKGSEIAVPRAWLPAPGEGEMYWADLIGLAVVNGTDETLGRIERVFSNGSHDVIEVVEDVQGEGQSKKRQAWLIPYVAQYVRSVDPEAGVVRVEWEREW